MRFISSSHGWLWHLFSEPISRADVSGLVGFAFGQVGWMIGPPGIISHIGVFAGGMCLGQVMRDRQQRAHERRMAQQQADHDALMREIQTMDFEALIALSQLKDSPMRRCPKCGRATYNRADITEGYCGACHEWT